jgi:hypothetical protein
MMAQVSLKAAIKKWGKEAVDSVGKKMKQLHWRHSFKPMHWKSLTVDQRKKVLESHIFVERKRDGTLKGQKVAGGNKQRGYIMKEDASSPTVSTEAVMLTCVIDANENRMLLLWISQMHSFRLLLRTKRTERSSASVVHWLISW